MISVAMPPNTILNNSGESCHAFLVPMSEGILPVFSLVRMILAVDLL